MSHYTCGRTLVQLANALRLAVSCYAVFISGGCVLEQSLGHDGAQLADGTPCTPLGVMPISLRTDGSFVRSWVRPTITRSNDDRQIEICFSSVEASSAPSECAIAIRAQLTDNEGRTWSDFSKAADTDFDKLRLVWPDASAIRISLSGVSPVSSKRMAADPNYLAEAANTFERAGTTFNDARLSPNLLVFEKNETHDYVRLDRDVQTWVLSAYLDVWIRYAAHIDRSTKQSLATVKYAIDRIAIDLPPSPMDESTKVVQQYTDRQLDAITINELNNFRSYFWPDVTAYFGYPWFRRFISLEEIELAEDLRISGNELYRLLSDSRLLNYNEWESLFASSEAFTAYHGRPFTFRQLILKAWFAISNSVSDVDEAVYSWVYDKQTKRFEHTLRKDVARL